MTVQGHKRVTGLSGNEIFCLSKLGLHQGQLCVGNSVVAIGVVGGIGAGLSNLSGGEVSEVTNLVHDGRMKAFNRMMDEAQSYGGIGLTGVSFDLVDHGGNLEFLTTASTVHKDNPSGSIKFSTSADAQQLYCQMDSGFRPLHFVFGNVAYSIGVGGNILGGFKSFSRGEISDYTQIFDRTRHLALIRICKEAKKYKANAVIGIETTITPLLGAQEMMMVGTASYHPALNPNSENVKESLSQTASLNAFGMDATDLVTSDMTNEELWNMVNLGYLPLRLVMGVSVYSLGLKAGIQSAFQSLSGGEVTGLTELLYEAREKALSRIQQDAERCGADDVVGVKINVYDLGSGLVEFMAIGTAVKKVPGITTKHANLLPQAIIQDRDTFIDSPYSVINMGRPSIPSGRLRSGPAAILFIIIVVLVIAAYIGLVVYNNLGSP